MAWTVPLDRLAAQAQQSLELVARKVTLDLFSAVARRSPVDTGRFRANWNVSQGLLDHTVTASTASGRVQSEVEKAQTLPLGGLTYMTNSLPYARALEYGLYHDPPKHPNGKTVGGYSKQAPAGMVRVTVVEFDAFVRRALTVAK